MTRGRPAASRHRQLGVCPGEERRPGTGGAHDDIGAIENSVQFVEGHDLLGS